MLLSENRVTLGEMDGIDALLQQLAVSFFEGWALLYWVIHFILCVMQTYKRHDPNSPEEVEMMENLFDCLCSGLMLPANRDKFLKGEGLQLMNLMLRSLCAPTPAYSSLRASPYLFYFLASERRKCHAAVPSKCWTMPCPALREWTTVRSSWTFWDSAASFLSSWRHRSPVKRQDSESMKLKVIAPHRDPSLRSCFS